MQPRTSSRRARPWLAALVIALGCAVAFMAWSLWSRSQTAMKTAVGVAGVVRAPDLPLPRLPGGPPSIPETPKPGPR